MLDINYAIEDTREQIAKLQRHLEILEALPAMPDYAHIWCNTNEVNVSIPYSVEKLREVRRLIGQGWRHVRARTFIDGSQRVHRYQHIAGGFLDINLNPDSKGATCQRVQIGVKEEPVFEIRCS